VRTSNLGWRIVAGGALAMLLGVSALSNNVGPSWFALTLLVAGAIGIFFGRRT
jgi:hypothetical protein